MGLDVSQEAEAAPVNETLGVELRESHAAGGETCCGERGEHLVIGAKRSVRRMCRRRWRWQTAGVSCGASCAGARVIQAVAACLQLRSSWIGRERRCWRGACTR